TASAGITLALSPAALAAGVTVFALVKVTGTTVRMIERHYGALLDGAPAGIAGRPDSLEAELEQAAQQRRPRDERRSDCGTLVAWACCARSWTRICRCSTSTSATRKRRRWPCSRCANATRSWRTGRRRSRTTRP